MRRASRRCIARARAVAAPSASSTVCSPRAAARPVGDPVPVVQCESGGQNLPPNSATASGYYQITDDTWRGLGGSTHHAFQASKAEQDRLAARLWNGGAGASNWVCAALVGIV